MPIFHNLAIICSFEKGRARNHGLMSIVRRSAAYSIGCQIKLRVRYIETDRNVADHGSRIFERAVRSKNCKDGVRASPSLGARVRQSSRPYNVVRSKEVGPTECTESCHQQAALKTCSSSSSTCQISSVRKHGSVAPAFLELFAGCARFSSAVAQKGMRIGVPIDVKHGKEFDLSNRKIQLVVLKWISDGLVWWVHLGTPCKEWSIAKTSRPNKAHLFFNH